MRKKIVLLGLMAVMLLSVTYVYARDTAWVRAWARAWVLGIEECTKPGVLLRIIP